MKEIDVQNLKLLYALGDRPYKASAHWTTTPFKRDPLLDAPEVEFKLDSLYENPQFNID